MTGAIEAHGAADFRRHRVGERIRWSDIDINGIILWTAYMRLLEVGETELFRALGFPYKTLWDDLDIWLPRAQVHIDYRNPLRMDDEVAIESWVGRIGRTSIRLEFAIHRPQGDLAGEAYAIIVAMDRKSAKPRPVPERLVHAMRPYRADLPGVTGGVGTEGHPA